MRVEPYLNFNGRCEEAIEFYKTAVGAEVVMMMRFKDVPGPANPSMGSPPPGENIAHAHLKVGATSFMASDGGCRAAASFMGITLSLTVDAVAEADKYFNALAEGGQITMPLNKTFYSPRFGMLNDRFGLSWMVMAQG